MQTTALESLTVHPEFGKEIVWDRYIGYLQQTGLLGNTREQVCERLLSAAIPDAHRKILGLILNIEQGSTFQNEFAFHLERPTEQLAREEPLVMDVVIPEIETTPAVVADLCAIVTSGMMGAFVNDATERIIVSSIEDVTRNVRQHVKARKAAAVMTPSTDNPAEIRIRIPRQLAQEVDKLVDSGLYGMHTGEAARWVIESQLVRVFAQTMESISTVLEKDDVSGVLESHRQHTVDPVHHWRPRGAINTVFNVSAQAEMDMAHLLATGRYGMSLNECSHRLLADGLVHHSAVVREMTEQRNRRFSEAAKE